VHPAGRFAAAAFRKLGAVTELLERQRNPKKSTSTRR
jgi:hypothetical protein